MEELKTIPFQPYMADFELLEQITDLASLSEEDRDRYDESLKVYRDNMAVLAFAEAKGEARGKARGKAEEKQLIARSLLARGMNTTEIAEITGLTLGQISELSS